jgi:hypothetical protein
VIFGVLGFGLRAIDALIFALQADSVDYGEWRSGVRAEGRPWLRSRSPLDSSRPSPSSPWRQSCSPTR